MSASGSSGFQIPYPAITLHAVSRGEAGPSIYCQLDDTYSPNSVNGATDQDDENDTDMRELVIVPSNSNTRETINIVKAQVTHCDTSGSNLRSLVSLRLPPPRSSRSR
jgi:hypothetical protein